MLNKSTITIKILNCVVLISFLLMSVLVEAKTNHKHKIHHVRTHLKIKRVPRATIKKTQHGIASWYGRKFHNKRTANNERFNMYGLTAASLTVPLNSYAVVTNLKNGKQVVVKITDRGPYVGHRIIDVSYGAAKKLGFVKSGTALVSIELIKRGQHEKQTA